MLASLETSVQNASTKLNTTKQTMEAVAASNSMEFVKLAPMTLTNAVIAAFNISLTISENVATNQLLDVPVVLKICIYATIVIIICI